MSTADLQPLSVQLTPALRAEYETNGVVILRGVFSAHWLDQAEAGIDATLRAPSQYSESVVGEGGEGAYFNDYLNWRHIPALRDYVLHSPAARIAKYLSGSRSITFYHEHVLCKEPLTAKHTPWHHDQSYYPLDGEQVCSIWMPVDHVMKKETLLFVKGSHNQGYFLPYKFATERPYTVSNSSVSNPHTFNPIPDDITQLGEVVGWEVAPGDCVVFNGKTVHGAPANMSSKHRRVLSTRWLGDDVIRAERPWVCSPPVVGDVKVGEKFQQEGLFPVVEC